MGAYMRGKEPPCPVKTPGCLGIIKDRNAVMCAGCARYKPATPSEFPQEDTLHTMAADRAKAKAANELAVLKSNYADSLKTINRLESELSVVSALDADVEPLIIEPSFGTNTNEGTVVAVASDWHVEEIVDSRTVNGLNTFNASIAQQRVTKFFQGVVRLTNLHKQDINIHTIVLALLGDFVTNQIHEEFAETNGQLPTDAIVTAQNYLIGGIEFLLAEHDGNIVLPCHSGNHARTTRTTRFGAENGHSLEYLMYLHLKTYFRNEPRVQFMVSEGYHSYLPVYDMTLRFHHGHAIKYGGGVGGIYIPTNKAIGQWSKARHADLDIFGHFHQQKDGGNFLSNGSLIGFNSFALAIKADYEPPRQLFFLIDKRRGRTATWPLYLQ